MTGLVKLGEMIAAIPMKVEEYPEAFTPWEPAGQTVLVQVRQIAKTVGSRGLLLAADDTYELARGTEVDGRLVKTGPLAFRNPDTGEFYPGAPWAKLGDTVRFRWYNFEKFKAANDERITFVIMDYLDIRAVQPQ